MPTSIASCTSSAISDGLTVGDGTTANTPRTSHVYEGSGTYTATLNLSDSGGKTASATAQITATGLIFATATATWSGPATIELSVLKGATPVQTAPQNCASQGSRTASVTLQGTSLTPGAYAVHARALNCPGAPAAPSITAVFSVITGNGTTTGPAATCNNVFSTIPVGAAAQQVCTFNVP